MQNSYCDHRNFDSVNQALWFGITQSHFERFKYDFLSVYLLFFKVRHFRRVKKKVIEDQQR